MTETTNQYIPRPVIEATSAIVWKHLPEIRMQISEEKLHCNQCVSIIVDTEDATTLLLVRTDTPDREEIIKDLEACLPDDQRGEMRKLFETPAGGMLRIYVCTNRAAGRSLFGRLRVPLLGAPSC